MLSRFIALTSASEGSVSAVTEQILNNTTAPDRQVVVLQGVRTAAEANAVYANHGEIWRIGDDAAAPELDPLVDRTIDDSTPERLRADVDKALRGFFGKLQVA